MIGHIMIEYDSTGMEQATQLLSDENMPSRPCWTAENQPEGALSTLHR
jgi:hypothetical protein